MIKLFNQDSSYFEVTSSDVNIEAVTRDVKSLTIVEEQMNMTTGSIVLRDDNQSYSKIFKPGATLTIGWGFKDPFKAIQNLITDINNPLEFKGPVFRKNLKAYLLSPQGSLNNNGTGGFIINFRSGLNSVNKRITRSLPIVGTPSTKGLVILQVLAESGYLAPFVLFVAGPHRMTDIITKAPLRQENETNFQFLRRKADEWNLTFQTGVDMAGIPQAIFCDHDKSQLSPFTTLTTGGIGLNNLFNYKGGVRNVLSATWENNFIQDGTGDHVQFALVEGIPVQQKSTAKTEKVLAYKLDMKKLTTEMNAIKKKSGIPAAQKFYQGIIDATDFQDKNIKKFWTSTEFKTAPQGGGIKVTIDCFGNPLYTPPNNVILGYGWPEQVTEVARLKMRKVTHTLDKGGYKCKIEVTDLFRK